MDHETALAESGKSVAPSRHHDIPGPSSHDDDESNDMARGGRQFARQTGCRRDAGHGSPFSLPLPYLHISFTCILNCTKKQGSFFIFSRNKQHACIFTGYECAATNQATTQRSLGIGAAGREMGAWQEERGHKRDAQREFQGWLFLFSFSLSTRLFPAVFSVHWGQQLKRTRGQQTEGVPYTVGGAGQAGKPKGVGFFYSDHTDSGSRMRSGKGSKQQQAEGM